MLSCETVKIVANFAHLQAPALSFSNNRFSEHFFRLFVRFFQCPEGAADAGHDDPRKRPRQPCYTHCYPGECCFGSRCRLPLQRQNRVIHLFKNTESHEKRRLENGSETGGGHRNGHPEHARRGQLRTSVLIRSRGSCRGLRLFKSTSQRRATAFFPSSLPHSA